MTALPALEHASVRVRAALARWEEELRRRYGFAAVALCGEAADGRLVLRGHVLLPSQVAEAQRRAAEAVGDVPVETALTVLADPQGGAEIGWARPDGAVLDLWRNLEMAQLQPDHGAAQRNRASQIEADWPALRVLARQGGWALVQAADLTLGWARESALVEAPDGRATWQRLLRAVPGKRAAVRITSRELCGEARVLLGTPYLWGGTTANGLDCSGFVQRVYRRASGLWLPRHSGDQRLQGERVPLSGLRCGDLVFLTLKERAVSHVALCLAGWGAELIHACLRTGRVITQPLDELLVHYDLRAIRRVADLEDGV
jgi:cell wall-associated NlpC family hydrolase